MIPPKIINRSPEISESLAIELAILRTVVYADVFEYPLRPTEIHRYLVGVSSPPESVFHALSTGQVVKKHLCQTNGYVTLAGREELIGLRKRRERVSVQLWPKAIEYGHLIAKLPFVRMVAVTGTLAVNNVDERVDLDYLIVTKPGRLWLCRAMVILMVHWAALKGDIICPNFFLSQKSLLCVERNLYTAHELVQMLPIAGLSTYWRMQKLNRWTSQFLPNAMDLSNRVKLAMRNNEPRSSISKPSILNLIEGLLDTPLTDWLEQWEMNRKISKLSRIPGNHTEVAFCADWCKGHFHGHGQRTLLVYSARLKDLGIEP